MPITTAQYKAAVEAKIAAATGATSLDDLTLIKSNADLWLRNNSSGTITGYAALEALIQAKQDTLTGGSTLDDISLAGMAALPPATARTLIPKRRTFTLSETWIAPAKIVPDSLRVTGCAGAGSGAIGRYWSSDAHYISGGQRGEFVEKRPVAAVAGQSFSVIVGSGGPASTQAYGENGAGFKDGNTGGNSSFGSLILRGGRGGRANNGLLTVAENMITAAGPRVVAQTQFLGPNDWRVWASLQAGVATPYAHGAFYVDWFNSTEGALLKRFIGGGDAGLFGAGSDFSSNQSTGNAPAANTGAGSGAAFYSYSGGWSVTLSSAPGSAGRWEAEWLEYE